ncbi:MULTISPECIES: IclR family transcriptional regulator [Nocardia]|uniref:IclR family transcriptional regulator n=1 Tax=Nocardia TaxID=1817 RepID=UPI001895AD24|nr:MULTISPECIES: IclR family transcriptional regulator [Nocardia]MBF6347916.1 IclR family transcriptional regulator [Nocardia flavorosea]
MTVVDSGSVAPVRNPRPDLPPSRMVERMTLILEAFDGPMARVSLESIAARTRLPRSTVYRILHQLIRLDWVEHAPSGYRLGRRALALGGGDSGRSRIRAVAAPLLQDLHLRTGLVVHLSVLDGGETVYLDKVGGRLAAALPSRVGGRGPAYATAGGRAMLAWTDPERVDALYRHRLDRGAERICDPLILHQELNRVRQRGGLAFGRCVALRGISCVGAAIRGIDGPVAGISLCGQADPAQLERVAPLVAHAAREIARNLHPVRHPTS